MTLGIPSDLLLNSSFPLILERNNHRHYTMIFDKPPIYDMENGYDQKEPNLGQSNFSSFILEEEQFMVLSSSTHTEDSTAITQLGENVFGHHEDYDDSTTQNICGDESIIILGTDVYDFYDGNGGYPIENNATNMNPFRESKKDKEKLFENSDNSDILFLEENFEIVQVNRSGCVGEAIMEENFPTFVPSPRNAMIVLSHKI
jgi:hypothetical protein